VSRPDFFFIGHPRSGSGRLDGYLQGHPDVFMARKELHFFGSDLHFNVPERSLDNYLAHFDGADGHTRIGESSTWYLASERAAEEIHDFAPDARVLMMLRNPVDWLHSLHSHMVFAAYEDIPDFADALAAEPERISGVRPAPEWSIPAGGVHYRSLVRYAEQVSRYRKVFGPERVHVVVFDDFRDAPEKTLDAVLRFLELPTDFEGREGVLQGSQRTTNSNRMPRSPRLQRWLKRPPQRSILHGITPGSLPGIELGLRALHRANINYVPRAKMSAALRTQLTEDFSAEVTALEDVLGRSLPWR
jgi:hypothetical protein